MKKITLLLLFFCTFLGYGQLETFEAGIPTTWKVMTGINGLGAGEVWKTSAAPNSNFPAYQGDQAAYVNNANVGANNTEEDWLIMNQRTIPADGQLRFFVRQTIESDQTTFLEIRVSANPTQDNQAAYTTLDILDETELNDLNGPITAYKEQIIDLSDYAGQTVYVAFVRVYKQLTPARAGDRFLIDNVNILSECKAPFGAGAPIATVFSTSATLTWSFPTGASSFEVEVKQESQNFNGQGLDVVNTAPPYVKTGLTAGTTYKYRVRTRCTDPQGNIYTSDWSNEFIFTTLPLGSVCSDPLVISALPYQVMAANTGTYGDEYDGLQGPSCGATPATTNYLGGAEVYYSYTAAQSGNISVTMTPLGATSTNSSVFVYTGSCTSITTGCIAGLANSNTNVRVLNLAVTAGQVYYIVVSSSAATQTINYDLLIQQENCIPKPANLTATNPAVNAVTLGWDNPGGYVSFEVEVQLVGLPIPSGPGSDTTGTNSLIKTNLDPAKIYQFWVRAECTPGSGIFTSWAGPFVFNTLVCNANETCNYTFRLTDSGNNGWGTNRMLVRQNGILVATLGAQIATGSGPVDVTVPICPNVPFDLFWSATGTSPGQCGVSIINSFNQTLYTKPANLSAVGTVLFSGVGKCNVPECNLMPTGLSAIGITTDGAILNWTAVATSAWEIYLVPAGSPAPTTANGAQTPPTGGFYYTGTAGGPDSYTFIIPDALDSDQAYDFYVRTPCTPNASPWAGPITFTTLPTCHRPIVVPADVTNITLNNATFDWTVGQAGDSSWEILLIPGPDLPPTPGDNPVIGGGTLLFPVNVDAAYTLPGNPLTAATIYYYYIRTVCPGDDKSKWAGPIKFNTITCDPADKCNYKFVLTNTSGNSWNGGRMQVRQNGILITTIGAGSINNAGGVTVSLCKDVPFDLYWSVAGTAPENIGVSIQNPFLDVIYTKNPGDGTPLSVVYAGVTNCTPAPCSKPTVNAASVVSVNATSVVLTWTDNSLPPSSAYDLYVVPTGQPAPINFPATAPTVSGVTLSGPGNTYTLSTINGTDPLLPSTSYTFYVRAVCGPGETSTWTILTPVTFITKPLNDECAAAIAVTVNPEQTCVAANNAVGNTYGATASLPILTPPLAGAGCGQTNRDVWYKFVAEHTSQTITINDVVTTPATGVALNFSVFSGTCDALTKINCYTTNTAVLANLTVNNTYYIRVYTAANTANQSATFKLCITSPPVNDECANATSVSINSDQTCLPANNAPGNTFGATASLPILTPPLAGAGCGQANRDVWYKFVAEHTSQTITLNDIVTTPATGVSLNFSVFSGTCNALTKINCYTANTAVLFNLTVNDTYYIRVYTANATAENQSATFNVCITSPPANDEAENAKVVSVNPNWNCLAFTTSGNTLGASPSTPTGIGAGCTTTDDDVWFKFVATNPVHQININDIIGTPTNTVTLSHAVLSGPANALVNMYCSAPNQSVAIGLTIGATYYIRVYTTANTAGQSATFNVCVSTPPPAGPNDECMNAVNVPVNPDAKCQLKTAGNIIGATASPPSTNCVGNENDDVWFSFVANGPRHIISLLNLEGTTTNLNFAVYQGSCGALTQKYCSAANSLTNVSPNNAFVAGQTYYLRVWSNSDLSQAVTFDVCIKSISTCENAGAICGASEDEPIIYENITGLPDNSQVACLGSIPNPTFYTIRVGQTGPLFFDILQYESFDANGQPQGAGYDVDYVCWGPFNSAESCNQISFTDCPTCPMNNIPNNGFYPFGNIVDCSYSINEEETLSIPNAQEGQYYVLLVTNFEDDPGYIKLVQTNFDSPTAGGTTCCDVNLGDPIIEVCAEDYELNAQFATDPNAELPTDYKWYLLPSTTPIPGATGATLTVDQSGTYKVEAQCGINTVDDTVQLILGPVIEVAPQQDYIKCDADNDGVEPFTLSTYLTSVLTGLTGNYNVTIHATEIAANGDTGALNVTSDLVTASTTVWIRIESATLATCYSVVSLKLVVAVKPNPEFNFDPIYCKDATTNPAAQFVTPGVVGSFTATPDGLQFVDAATGVINLLTTTPNTYVIKFTIPDSPLTNCGVIEFSDTVTILAKPEFTLTGVKDICPDDQTTVQIVVSNNTFVLATATYKWFKDTNELIGETASSLSIDGQADYGSYKVVVDNQGCIAEQTFSIGNSNTDWGVSIVSTDDALCGTETAVLTVNIANNPTGAAATYTYTLPDMSQVTSTNNTLPISVFGVYSVNVNILGCESNASITIDEGIADWQVNFGGPYVICPGQPVDLSFTPVNFNINDAVFNWTSPSGAQSAGATLNGVTEVGQYILNINISGCKNDVFVNVTANTDVISIDLESGCEGQKFIVRALPLNNSFDPLTSDYEWSGTGFTTTADDNTVVITSKGVVTVKVTTDQGCFGTEVFDSTNINLGCVIQKGISPNNNGENDTFDLSGYNVAKLTIFNRYGTEVYQRNNYVNEWGGQSNSGDELTDGVYFYVIDLVEGGTKNGWIYINR